MKFFSHVSTLNFFAILWYVLIFRETHWLLIVMAVVFGFLAISASILSDMNAFAIKSKESIHLNINIDNITEASKNLKSDLDRIEEKIAEIFS